MSIEKKPHPIATMAPPTQESLQSTLVDNAWHLRESAGACERYLDSDVPDVEFDQVMHPGQLSAGASWCSSLADSLVAPEASKLFAAASADFGAAATQLVSYAAHAPLTADYENGPRAERFEELYDDKRRFAARATKSGRQLVHLGLSKLVEMWPGAYAVDADARDGDDT